MRIGLFAIVVALAPATMSSSAFADDVAASPKPDDDEKIVCRRERLTGSRLPKKICMTKADWKMVSDRSRESMDRQGPPLRRTDAIAAKPQL